MPSIYDFILRRSQLIPSYEIKAKTKEISLQILLKSHSPINLDNYMLLFRFGFLCHFFFLRNEQIQIRNLYDVFLTFPSPFSFLLPIDIEKKKHLKFQSFDFFFIAIPIPCYEIYKRSSVNKTKKHNEIYGFSLSPQLSGFIILPSTFCISYSKGLTTKKKKYLYTPK